MSGRPALYLHHLTDTRRLAPILVGLASLCFLLLLVFYLDLSSYSIPSITWWPYSIAGSNSSSSEHKDGPHPILTLIAEGEAAFNELLSHETLNLTAAASAYRQRRGRHPPPGFDRWFQYAQENDAIMVEEFWDQIYHDLTPFWALDPVDFMRDARSQNEILKIRNGKTTANSDHFWVEIWLHMVDSVAQHLPDMDIAINMMDEPRLFIPWEDINNYVDTAQKSRSFTSLDEVLSEYSGQPEQDMEIPESTLVWDIDGEMLWRLASSCPPDSRLRGATLQTEFSLPPTLRTEFMTPHIRDGYVSNYSLSTSLCHQPDLQGLHGFIVSPLSIKSSNKLFPYFGGSKTTLNSEILWPSAMYYESNDRFLSLEPPIPWFQKLDRLVWRGIASGGRSSAENWKGFHRHRLISMLNGTQAIYLPGNSSFVDIQNLPLEMWDLEAWSGDFDSRHQSIGIWLESFIDAGFTSLVCFPQEQKNQNGKGCSYTDHLFSVEAPLSLGDEHYSKYLIDIDGNSFSGRFLDFLHSKSLPIKSTIFREWHDSRLVPWKHFIPFDNRYLDIYGILEFFVGVGPNRRQGHDELAMSLGESGSDWASKVLRLEDMRIYTYRLLLEYARVTDAQRERLGWVDDLLEKIGVHNSTSSSMNDSLSNSTDALPSNSTGDSSNDSISNSTTILDSNSTGDAIGDSIGDSIDNSTSNTIDDSTSNPISNSTDKRSSIRQIRHLPIV